MKVTSKKDLINYFAALTITEKYTPIAGMDLQFEEDDFFICGECKTVQHPTTFFMVEPMTDKAKGVFICDKCHEDHMRPERHCSGCNKRLKHTDNPVPVNYFLNGQEHPGECCRECNELRRYHATYVTCGACTRFEAPDRMADAEGNTVCQTCVERNYYHCPHCEEYHRTRDGAVRAAIPKMNLVEVGLRPIEALVDAEHAGIVAAL